MVSRHCSFRTNMSVTHSPVLNHPSSVLSFQGAFSGCWSSSTCMYLLQRDVTPPSLCSSSCHATWSSCFLYWHRLALKQLGAAVPACRVVDKAADDRLRELRVEARPSYAAGAPWPPRRRQHGCQRLGLRGCEGIVRGLMVGLQRVDDDAT